MFFWISYYKQKYLCQFFTKNPAKTSSHPSNSPKIFNSKEHPNFVSGSSGSTLAMSNQNLRYEAVDFLGEKPRPTTERLSFQDIWEFPNNRGKTPKSSILIGFSNIINYKPSILGYPYFGKHPFFVFML